ncbi:MAG: guanylate kinase [Chloroflexi bacterium]|jgi:guanylate kinase|nr:guanylate kinase [Chloroflexota bacterium]MBT4072500.1 guanylate kinase [Chloroflexota bacterium]MBT4514204.1 guanylate kinase [Chloroflexota bacterium]MBT6680425.1 guanylate kinase [Chloroflexota bacterium]
MIVVLSGPSGVGKDAILERMAELDYPYHFVITATTRDPRPGEVDEVNHYFVDRPRFQELIDSDELLEHAEVYGNMYGVPKQQVRDALAEGRHVMIRVDVQGAARIRQLVKDALLIFIKPPNLQSLQERLEDRGVDALEAITVRRSKAIDEIADSEWFDYVVINRDDRLDDAVNEVIGVIDSESEREPPRVFKL